MKFFKYFIVYVCLTYNLVVNCEQNEKMYDAVYIINLDKSPERMEKISKQLNSLGIKFKRFSAIDGRELKIKNIDTDKIEDTKSFVINKNFENNKEYEVSIGNFSVIYKTDKTRLSRYLSFGEIGCAMSHLAVMHDIVKNNFKRTIIFEDDLIFEKNLVNSLNLTLLNTPDDFDILFLDVGVDKYYVDLEKPLKDNCYIANPSRLLRSFYQKNNYILSVSKNNNLYGTCAYCISLNGAKRIIQNYNPIREPVDEYLFHNSSFEDANRYVARKKMLYISDDLSIITQMGRDLENFWKKNKN